MLRDELKLATPPAHPSEAPAPNPNPLATTILPPTAGVALSLASTGPKRAASRFYHLDAAFSAIPSFGLKDSSGSSGGAAAAAAAAANADKESRTSHETGSSGSGSHGASQQPPRTPAFGAGNALLATSPPGPKDVGKRRKPKTSMAKTNSSFISRFVPHDALHKRLQSGLENGGGGAAAASTASGSGSGGGSGSSAGNGDGTNGVAISSSGGGGSGGGGGGLYAFANVGRAFVWLDLAAAGAAKADPLTRILFAKAHLLCHDANAVTKAPGHLDLVAGSSAADLVWYEPFAQRYARLNKNGAVNPAPVACVRWIPGSESLFLAAHMDGTLVVYDKEREDAAFVPEDAPSGPAATAVAGAREAGSPYAEPAVAAGGGGLHVQKSVNSKNQKTNPVALWKLSNQKINAFAFAPDARHLAVVSEDGALRIIDYLAERLLDVHTSYYGGLTCVGWSPDGRYLLTGGQDDLVSIWSRRDRALVARCAGHRAWVAAVAFDPWRCDDAGNYRFGSVGEDGRLLLWDFNVGMLHRPKAAALGPRASVSGPAGAAAAVAAGRLRADSLNPGRLRSHSSLTMSTAAAEESVEHPVESRTRTAELPPVMSKVVDPDPLSWLGFQEDCIITSCVSGTLTCSTASLGWG